MGFPGGSDGKESTCNVGDLGSIPGLGRSTGIGHGSPLQCSCLENPHGQRSLEGCNPWGHKESNTTEWLNAVYNNKCFKGEERSLCNLEETGVKWGYLNWQSFTRPCGWKPSGQWKVKESIDLGREAAVNSDDLAENHNFIAQWD